MPTPLPYGQALRTARRIGIVGPHSSVIAEAWRPLWWAVCELGWLDEPIVDNLSASAKLPGGVSVRRQVRGLVSVRWLATGREPFRPAKRLAVTRRGRVVLLSVGQSAPPWTASSMEVARRAVAEFLRNETAPFEATAAASEAVCIAAARWGRLIRERDVREVIVGWRRAGLLRHEGDRAQRWLLTPFGHRSLRAVSRAVHTRQPRRPRIQDQDHDVELVRLVNRLMPVYPDIIGTLRLARRVWLPSTHAAGQNRRWIVPDGLVGFHTVSGAVVLAIEVERRGTYDNLARHTRNYGALADRWPQLELRILVVTHRVSAQRQMSLADALAALTTHRRRNIDAVLTSPRQVESCLTEWQIRPSTPTFTPPE